MKKLITILSIVFSKLIFAYTIEGNEIVDSFGNRIEKKEYNKVIILDMGSIETFYLLGADEKIEAISHTITTPIWPYEKTAKVKSVGSFLKPSVEQIIALQPDLVITNPMSSGIAPTMKAHNIPSIVNTTGSIDEIGDNFKIFGIITGKESEAKKLEDTYKVKVEKIRSDLVKKPLNMKGVYLFSTSPLISIGGNSLGGEVLKTLGIKNLAEDKAGERPILSLEYFLEENPDIILGGGNIKDKEAFLNTNPILKRTNAGKNKNLFFVDTQSILRGSPRIIDTLEELHNQFSKIKK